MTDKTVEEILAEAAAATEASKEAAPKKERVKKTVSGTDAGGGTTEKPEKKPAKEKTPAKTYPQADAEGNADVDEAGEPVMGPYATRYKAPKVAAAPKLDADGNPIPRAPRGGKFPADAVISLLAEANPKRAGSASHARFEAYHDGITIGEALAAGLTHGDFHHDTAHGFISVAVGEPIAE